MVCRITSELVGPLWSSNYLGNTPLDIMYLQDSSKSNLFNKHNIRGSSQWVFRNTFRLNEWKVPVYGSFRQQIVFNLQWSFKHQHVNTYTTWRFGTPNKLKSPSKTQQKIHKPSKCNHCRFIYKSSPFGQFCVGRYLEFTMLQPSL